MCVGGVGLLSPLRVCVLLLFRLFAVGHMHVVVTKIFIVGRTYYMCRTCLSRSAQAFDNRDARD